ncbi:MAG: signal peptide peptidase SppA, partial [Gammaproteobacteria bacterium]|nr:signal peptide peptidase SppA [Gammaproteobacteria bacterium]
DGVGTTQFSGQFRLDRDLSEAASNVLQLSIEYGYKDFVNRVAAARDMTFEEVDAVARGRVWIGATAQTLNLVDKLGDFDEAVAAAAAMAGLGDDYPVRYIEKELSFRETVALQLAGQARSLVSFERHSSSALEMLASQFNSRLGRLVRFNDPQNLYYFCDCSVSQD